MVSAIGGNLQISISLPARPIGAAGPELSLRPAGVGNPVPVQTLKGPETRL
jgi:hypothetical protein